MKRRILASACLGGLVVAWGSPCFAEQAAPFEPGTFSDQEIIVIRGEPMAVWPFEDLRAKGFDIPEISREDNAFWVYLDAINAFKSLPENLEEPFSHALTEAWPTGRDEALKEYLLDEDNQRAMSLVRQAAEEERLQLYYFGDPRQSIINVLLPSLKDYRFLAKLLVVDGRRLQNQGAHDLALENFVTPMRMGHHVAGGITLIEALVGIAVWATGDLAICQTVLRHDLSAAQLEELLELHKDLGKLQPSIHAGFRNERAFGMRIVDETLTLPPLQMFRNFNAISGGGAWTRGVLPTSDAAGWGALEARISKLLLPDRTVKSHMNGYYDRLIELGELPAYEARWDRFDADRVVASIPQWDVLSRMLLPSLSRAAVLGERCRMQTQATRLAIALRLFMKRHDGQPPVRLAELEELLSPEDLIDPFSGREFVYELRDDGWRFYSFSENFVDDGGTEGRRPFDLDYVIQFPPAEVEPLELDETGAVAP